MNASAGSAVVVPAISTHTVASRSAPVEARSTVDAHRRVAAVWAVAAVVWSLFLLLIGFIGR